ncbi:MAG: hypothetical protein LBQ81_07290 [Zoogloeaceae bacterium]|jgi:hypothetical protein|nr:hypothetical protein [Zoogloeaceae bacterium]
MSEAKQGMLFAGTAYIAMLNPDTQQFGNFKQLEIDQFEIATPSDKIEKTSKSRENFGQVFLSYPVPTPATFAVTFSEVSKEIFAMLLSGAIKNRSAGTVDADIVVAADNIGDWLEIPGASGITGAVVETGAGAVVDGLLYELNPRAGLIRFKTASDLAGTGESPAAPGTFNVVGTIPAGTGTVIAGGQAYNNIMKIRLDGKNLYTNEDVLVTVPRASVASSNAYNFLSGEFAEVPLEGSLLIEGSEPAFTVEYL